MDMAATPLLPPPKAQYHTQRVILFDAVEAHGVSVCELVAQKLEPLDLYWHTILFIDDVFDVNDLGYW